MTKSEASIELLRQFEMKEMPKGWKVIEGTTTQPVGYVWIKNEFSLFAKDKNGNRLYKHGLIKEELIRK